MIKAILLQSILREDYFSVIGISVTFLTLQYYIYLYLLSTFPLTINLIDIHNYYIQPVSGACDISSLIPITQMIGIKILFYS